MRFVVLEYPGTGLPLAEWTRGRPVVRADMILEPMRAEGGALRVPGLLLVRGCGPEDFGALQRMLESTYAPLQPMRSDPRRGEWLGRFTIHVANMRQSPAALVAARHADRLGTPWSHVQDGVVYSRFRPRAGEDPDALADLLRAQLQAHGAEADVSTQELGPHDYGVWDDLVQASIGLRP